MALFAQTYPSSHTFWHVFESSGIWIVAVIGVGIVVTAGVLLRLSRKRSRRGQGPRSGGWDL